MSSRAWLPALALVLACDAGPDTDPLVADCEASGVFALELAIPEGDEPELIHGLQGGTHLILAAELRTPDPLERYQVSLRAETGQAPCVEDGCAAWVEVGGFARELDSEHGEVEPLGPEAVELNDLFVVVDGWALAPRRRLSLEVSDVCGRSASTLRTFE